MNTNSLIFQMKVRGFRGKLETLGGGSMGLKFQREDSLDKMFDEFAILPDNDKKENKPDIERFLNNSEETKEDKDTPKQKDNKK
jgi:hypothetical protein